MRIVLTRSADVVDIGSPAFRTGARHRSDGNSVENVAPSVLWTWFDHRAWIDALVLDTYKLVGAVDVDSALRFVERQRRILAI